MYIITMNYCLIYCIFFHCQIVGHLKPLRIFQQFRSFRKRYKNSCSAGERSPVWKYDGADEFNQNILLPTCFNLSSF